MSASNPNPSRQNIGHLPYMALVDYALRKHPKRDFTLLANDDREMLEMREALRFFAPNRPVIEWPAWDCRPYDRISPHPSLAAQRANALLSLAQGQGGIVLSTQNALMQKLPPKSIIADQGLSIALGKTLDLEHLRRFAQISGYQFVSNVRSSGEISVRGGIVDLFPSGFDLPVRLDLFGDVVDQIRNFDPITQRSKDPLQGFTLAPSGELILTPETIASFREKYRALRGVPAKDDPYYEAVSAGIRPQGIEHYLSLFYPELDHAGAYLGERPVFMREEAETAIEMRFQSISEHQSQKEEAQIHLAPNALYLDAKAFMAQFSNIHTAHFGAIPTGANAIDAGYSPARDFAPERADQSGKLYQALSAYVQKESQNRPVWIACASEGSRKRMQNLLNEYNIANTQLSDEYNSAIKGVILTILPITHGFEHPEILLISESDILGARLSRRKARRKNDANQLGELTNLSLGSLVVHRDHGIGRFVGMQSIEVGGAPHECLTLEYHGADKLFVPAENIDVISPYGEEHANLDKLGASSWQERKARTKKDLLAMADGLIKIAAERNLRKAPIMQIDTAEYEAFAVRFPYEETEDQLLAIEETANDLASGRPMDRLICGDVGFGKTEIAMRAAFIAASAGYQVALISPTTLLSRQHIRNFKERFAGTGLIIEQLSRFVKPKDQKLRKDALKAGKIDIIIGTHALLSQDVKFKNLGLLIVDEEQHFGVKHKEKIKELRSDVHVLTLTATPIPRTLQLALTGVRELSIIATPPVDRLAVRTYVAPFERQMIKDALMQERMRGGQSFYVVPRISDLPDIEEFLSTDCPDLRVITAHGQMPAAELDQRVNDFYDGKADVLLATTIIESGLDIPTANTLIVHRADMFGLAQLYQIRGRVGRSKLRAFAYLTTKKGAVLNPAAEKRLRVLSTLDSLGSGFNLASFDLDLRGAGNLLGEEQSGDIKEVGFALYQSMLKDAISSMKSGDLSVYDQDVFSPEISLGVAVMIPENYITDLDTRLSFYRRLARLRKRSEIDELAAEMIDRFGALPNEIETLFQITRIKAFARVAGIQNFDAGSKGAIIRFRNNKFVNPKGLIEFISSEHGRVKVKDTRIIVLRDWSNENRRLSGSLKVVAQLAKIAKEAPEAN